MKTIISDRISLALLSLMLLFIPAVVEAYQSNTRTLPSINAPLVREGTYAVSLARALRIVTTTDEINAESRLGELGITPKNGWMADYPVTPDILLELKHSLIETANAGRLIMGREEALRYWADVNRALGLPINPEDEEVSSHEGRAMVHPDETEIDDYYRREGPPVVSYYAPPSDFLYLYAWIPSPFWWAGFWFSGYYILHDFHHTIYIHKRPFHVTNHLRDHRQKGFHRVDPEERFHGKDHRDIRPRGDRRPDASAPPIEKKGRPTERPGIQPPAPIAPAPAPSIKRTEPPTHPQRNHPPGISPPVLDPTRAKPRAEKGGKDGAATGLPISPESGKPREAQRSTVSQPVISPATPSQTPVAPLPRKSETATTLRMTPPVLDPARVKPNTEKGSKDGAATGLPISPESGQAP